MKKFWLGIVIPTVILVSSLPLQAQRGGRPGGFDPDEMIKREKQNVYNAINDLNDDQKLLLDGIYDEYSISFKELREEMRRTRDFQAMRPKMQALQAEKNDLIKDVLSEEQFAIYIGMIEERRRQFRESRSSGDGNQPGRRQNQQQNQAPDTLAIQPPQNQQ